MFNSQTNPTIFQILPIWKLRHKHDKALYNVTWLESDPYKTLTRYTVFRVLTLTIIIVLLLISSDFRNKTPLLQSLRERFTFTLKLLIF